MIIYLLNIRIYLIRCCSFFLVSLYIISPTYISIPNVSAIREGPFSNIVSIVKPASYKISFIPFEISSISNLSSFFYLLLYLLYLLMMMIMVEKIQIIANWNLLQLLLVYYF